MVLDVLLKGFALLGALLFFAVSGAAYGSPSRILVRSQNEAAEEASVLPRRMESSYLPLTRTQVFTIPEDVDPATLLKELQQDPSVKHAELDAPIHAHTAPNDALYDLQWPLLSETGNIGAEAAWNITSSAENILVAVIDSGCDETHEDIQNNLWNNEGETPGNGLDDDGNGYVDDVHGYDFFNNDPTPADDYGHGTIVFGIIGAAGNNQVGVTGLAWNARILCLKVLDAEGNSSVSVAVEAMEYAIREGAKIINMSWGYSPGGEPSQVLKEALKKAKEAGVLVVTSAGNGSASSTGFNNDLDPQMANYPSSYPEENIIAVAATNDSDEMAAFSNFGPVSVDLGAPGVNIYSTAPGNQYEAMTGTSASAPHVTGSAALVWSLNPGLSYDQIKRLLLETADPNPTLQGKTLTGGRLNVAKAVMASPAAGGQLLSSPPPTYNTSLAPPSAPTEASGGCSLQGTGTPFGLSSLLFLSGIFLAGIFRVKRKL